MIGAWVVVDCSVVVDASVLLDAGAVVLGTVRDGLVAEEVVSAATDESVVGPVVEVVDDDVGVPSPAL